MSPINAFPIRPYHCDRIKPTVENRSLIDAVTSIRPWKYSLIDTVALIQSH